MKVLVLSHEYPPVAGGGATACREISRGLASLGHEPFVVTAAVPGLAREEEEGGPRVVQVGCGKRDLGPGTFLSFARYIVNAFAAAWRLHREIRFDRTLAIFAAPAGLVAWAMRVVAGVPYVLRLGGSDVPGYNPARFRMGHRIMGWLARPVWRRAAAVVANSGFLKKLASGTYPEVAIEVIPNGIDLDRFHPGDSAAPATEGPPPALPLRLLTVASLTHKKGIRHLVEAMRILARDGQDAELDVIGTGPEEKALDEAIRLAGLAGRVRLAGVIPRERLPGWYRAADALVLPSLAESFSNALLEALASGLAVVATDVGGTRTLVRDGWNGFIAPPGDAGALAEAIARLAALPAGQRRGMGARSREMAQAFGWGAIVQRYLNDLARAR